MRARIALAVGDRDGFEQWAERFADFSKAAENPAIRGQYERLIRLGSRTGVHEQAFPTTPDTECSSIADRFTSATLKARLDHCIDRTERARLALSLVLQACDANRGHLFGVRQGTLQHLGSFPEPDAPPTLQPVLAELLEQERGGDGATVIADEPAADSSAPDSPYSRVAELGFNAQVLLANRTGEPAIVGIVVVEQEPGKTTYVPAQVAEGVADALAEQGDVDPMTCFAD
jgi:hypothetical protein